MTNNLERRLNEHNKGQNKSTKAYTPWSHIHTEEFENRQLARKREIYFKSFRGRKLIRNVFVPEFKAR